MEKLKKHYQFDRTQRCTRYIHPWPIELMEKPARKYQFVVIMVERLDRMKSHVLLVS